MDVTILLLAAGSARRFGTDKRRAALPNGSTILTQTCTRALKSGLPVLVCLGDERDTSLVQQLQALGAKTRFCDQAHLGMGHTLACGVTSVREADGVLVALGDMPYIQPSSYRAVADALSPGTISVPECDGKAGHPVGFSRPFFTALASLTGDRGAKAIIDQNPRTVTRVALHDQGIFADIDKPGDLARA